MADILHDKIAFGHALISTDFGIPADKLADDFLASGTAVIYKYGLNHGSVVDIINTCRSNGVSAEFLLAKTVAEGGGNGGGFVNQYQWDTGQGYKADLIRDLNWIKATANDPGYMNLAWDDPGGGTVGMVPASVRAFGNADAQTMPVGSFGRLLLQGSAAAVWGMYYPQGLLRAYNGVQDYADGIGEPMRIIAMWGGKADGTVSNPDGKPGTKKNTEKNPCLSLYNYMMNMLQQSDKWLH